MSIMADLSEFISETIVSLTTRTYRGLVDTRGDAVASKKWRSTAAALLNQFELLMEASTFDAAAHAMTSRVDGIKITEGFDMLDAVVILADFMKDIVSENPACFAHDPFLGADISHYRVGLMAILPAGYRPRPDVTMPGRMN